MLKSMTGFGRAEQSVKDKTFLIDVKSLNGKQFDLQLKLPAVIKPYEFEIRKILSEKLGRGSVECIISLKETGSAKPVSINTDLARAYYEPIAKLSKELGLDDSQILSSLLKLPEVITPSNDSLGSDEWNDFKEVLNTAITNINKHRADEGVVLENDLLLRINNIEAFSKEIAILAPLRKEKVRENLIKLLQEETGKIGKEKIDENRLEQELVYYIEKIDISEEQVRLSNHCEYFKELLQETEEMKGKKLSFLLQEFGREINTTGAKAYDAGIQKIVVQMKDELEKAKEQILNVL